MELFLIYFGIMFIGYIVGAKFRKKEIKPRWTGKFQMLMIILLIFIMGARLTVNQEVVKSLDSIGMTAFILTIFIMIGSVAGVIVIRKIMGIDNKGVRTRD